MKKIMTTYEITAPDTLTADINLPASKSISNRALIIHALSGGSQLPENLSDCDDTRAVINALRDMPETIDVGAAGTAMRFMTAYLAVTEGEHTITGSERMRHRPIGVLVDALRMLGADIDYVEKEGFPPLHIQGHELLGGKLEIPGNVSSQFISALLLIGPVMKLGLSLHLTGEIVSRPYIDLTIHVMHGFGAEVDWTSPDTIEVQPKPYSDAPYLIENDWSASSYWYEMASLYPISEAHVALRGLEDSSRQGDSVVKYIFSLLGVKTTFDEPHTGKPTTVRLTRHLDSVAQLSYDFLNCPDLAQTVVATCCGLGVTFHFTGLASLRIKETDRLVALQKELRKLGFLLQIINNEELLWDGSTCEPTMEPIDTYEDHRMAMALAPLAVKFPRLRINNPEVVSKSYPDFWKDLRKASFTINNI
ncbi:MAG: 3-phosphoshikimate 1-carboxyvinyltransferase [Prevotella sp.]